MNERGAAHCEVLGGFRIFDRAGAELRFPVIKGAAIITYLGLTTGNQASRGKLTGLLWGDKPEAAARTALRQCLHQMRTKLSTSDFDFLTIDPQSITLDRSKLGFDIDAILDPDRIMDAGPPGTIALEQFLSGFEDLDPAFSEWLSTIRVQLDERFKANLKATLSDPTADKLRRLRAAEHLNVLDPSQEIAARPLIEQAVRQDDLVSMLRIYQRLWDALDEDWGEEPSADLQAFVGETRARFGDTPKTDVIRSNVTSFRKYVTVLALAMESDYATTTSSPNAEMERASRAVTARGGMIVRSRSGRLCAVFGLNASTENSARDSLEAALELGELLKGARDVQIGVGLDTGYVLVTPPASAAQQPEIVGPVIDQTAALARSGHDFIISATTRTMYGIERFYVVAEEPGTETPASRIMRVTGRRSTIEIDLLRGRRETFVGRAPFLAALWEIWTEALETESLQIASIQGAAGVGKTRLVGELMRRLSAEGIKSGRAICNRYDRSSPLQPLRDLLHSLRAMPGEPVGYANPSHPVPTTDTIMAELIDALDGRPAAIFLDDWQWADDATRLVLGRLVTFASSAPLLLLLTSRNVPTDDWLVTNSHQFVLPNFTAREVVERAELLLEKPIDEELKRQLLAKSGGNPLFLEEVCHALDCSSFGGIRDGVIADLPANVQALFASRFEALAANELELLFAVATHGDRVDTDLLSRVIGQTAPPTVLERLGRSDILADGPATSICFKHSLARDVVYNMIPDDQRRSLHLCYAKALRGDGDPGENIHAAEALAFHYRNGGDILNAADFSEKSGDKALNASALDQAIWHYGTALNLVDQLPLDDTVRRRWVSLAIRWAIPKTYAPSYEQLPLLERAETMAKQVGDANSAVALRYWIGYFTYVLGEKSSALESFRAAKKLADTIGDTRQSVEISAIEGCLLASIARYDEAEATLRAAIATKERNPGKGNRAPVTSVYARANLALLRADQGSFEEARTLIEEALLRVRGFEHEVESSILLFAGTIDIWRGDWNAALHDARLSRERSEKVSSPYLMGMSRCIWGYAHWKNHRSPLGLETLARNARWMHDREMCMYFSLICGWLADALADAGRYREAEEAYRDAHERASYGEIVGMTMACRASARCALAEGRLDDAAARLSEADIFAERRNATHDIAANTLTKAQLYRARKLKPEAHAALETAKALYSGLGLDIRHRMACDAEAELSG